MIVYKNRDDDKLSPSLDYEALLSMPLPLFHVLDLAASQPTAPAARAMDLTVQSDAVCCVLCQHAATRQFSQQQESRAFDGTSPWAPTAEAHVVEADLAEANLVEADLADQWKQFGTL
jgi:hypothetical protein